MSHLIISTVLLAAVVTACSSASDVRTTHVTSSGTVHGATLVARDGMAINGGASGPIVVIADYARVCDDNHNHASSTVLSIEMTPPFAGKPGRYTLEHVSVSLFKNDAKCEDTLVGLMSNIFESTSTVTIDAVDASWIRGAYSLTFNNETMSGTFDVPFCNDMPVSDGGLLPCE